MIDKKCVLLSLVSKKYKGFTLAEILLSLSIIGIVAAIALPSLLGNVHERAFETQKKALYTRFSQGISLLPSLNGYGQLEGTFSEGTKWQEGYVPQNVTVDTAAESFVRDGLSKVMKITNICDNEHLSDCGLPDKIISMNGGSTVSLANVKSLAEYNDGFLGKKVTNNSLLPNGEYEQLNTKAAGFETVNGESILVYYNPNCEPDLKENDIHFTQPKLCANFVYDLNGKKGPNTVGKDIGFITALYSTDPIVVAPNPYPVDTSQMLDYSEALEKCKAIDDNAKLPNIDELTSIYYNKKLLGTSIQTDVWSNTQILNRIYRANFYTGRRYLSSYFDAEIVAICVKR